MQRIMTSAALVFASALLLSGCAAGGGGEATADPCETVRSEVRDISNGAQNVLAAGGDPGDVQAALEEYVERVGTLDETAGDDASVSEALDALSEALDEAVAFAETLPSDPEAEVDAEAVAELQTAVQEAATEVASVCAPETEG